MNYLETIKNIAKDKKKRKSNLIFLLILMVVLLISFNYIFSDNKTNLLGSDNNIKDSIQNKEESINETNTDISNNDLEVKLESILSKISGVSDVSVVLSYSKEKSSNVVYNTKEIKNENNTSSEKEVAYNENGSNKTAIIESVELPKVEGAIVVAKGANTTELKSKIATAVATITSLPVYKVQVFEKE